MYDFLKSLILEKNWKPLIIIFFNHAEGLGIGVVMAYTYTKFGVYYF